MTTPVDNLIRKVFLKFINSGEPYLKTRLIAKVYTEITGNKKYDYLGYESRNPSMHRITNIYKELIDMEEFVTALAWIFGILSTGLFLIRCFCTATYSDITKMLDQAKGIYDPYPIAVPGMLMIACWCWVFTR